MIKLETLRHSCSHVLAQAVKELWPEVKVAIGPAIENGFYYDFDRKESFTDADLSEIAKRMRKIIARKEVFRQEFWPKKKAIEYFQSLGEKYKVELIENIPDENVSIFVIGEKGFLDLCKGPHVANTGEIGAFKLLSVAGAYWRGDEKRDQLQRIYGTCFPTEKELNDYLTLLEEAQKRDHRKLGPQLELFQFFHESAGGGLVFYLPDGALLRRTIEDYVVQENLKRGYELVSTPHILRGKLWEQSGHSGFYRENMYYLNIDDEEYAVKPMNCPGHMLIYNSKIRSYRDLPIRFFELGNVYRYEKAGVLHGLLRVRGFTQDDAHIFCTPTQLKEEIKGVIDFVFDLMRDFGFNDMHIEVSTRPEKYIGELAAWDLATETLKAALEDKKLGYQINEGDGAFYGPKIDIKLKDAIGRQWQCATIQCDFSLPERFRLTYVNEDGQEARPIMIHRAILGSVERFFGTLIEHYGGAFPLWLAPKQVEIIPIKEDQLDYAKKIKETLQKQGIRVIIDSRNESLAKRIREGTVRKIPYLVVLGDKEQQAQKLAVRKYSEGDLGTFSLEEFSSRLMQQIKEKT